MTSFIETFDTEFMPRLGMRGPTMRAVIRECLVRNHKAIVETGCLREKDNWEGDGQSSVIWANYVKQMGGSFKTFDIDEAACKLTNEIVPGFPATHANSLRALLDDQSNIDLLYLDSYDVDMNDQHPAALHCLMELLSARKRLVRGSIVFVDDSPVGRDFVVTGKGRYVAEYFRDLSIAPFTFAYQVAWLIP